MNLPYIQQKLRNFAEEINWDQLHSPKNFSVVLAANPERLPYVVTY